MEVPQELLNEVGLAWNYYLEENNINVVPIKVIKDYFDSIPVDCQVKPAKNVKDYDWLNNKLDEILGELEHKHITKAGAKDRLFEFIFEELVNEIQKLKDSSLSV